MIVNFRVCKINRGIYKLTQTIILIEKKKLTRTAILIKRKGVCIYIYIYIKLIN